jgi:hypothetical protein
VRNTFLLGDSVSVALCSPIFWWCVLSFVLMQVVSWTYLTDEDRQHISDVVTYPAAVVSTLFAFMLGLFTNSCYQRFQTSWRAAMTGWSRLNDLGLQVFAYVEDRNLACEVIRLMHAANHLCYGEFAGHADSDMKLAHRRHLLTDDEIAVLRAYSRRLPPLRAIAELRAWPLLWPCCAWRPRSRSAPRHCMSVLVPTPARRALHACAGRPGGVSPFYLCSCWALQLVARSGAQPQFIQAMDLSIREWRQQTTLLPLMWA